MTTCCWQSESVLERSSAYKAAHSVVVEGFRSREQVVFTVRTTAWRPLVMNPERTGDFG